MNANSTLSLVVEGGGTQVVGSAGLHALGRFADRIGLPQSLSRAVPWTGERAPLHDRGKVLTHAMLMLAAGGEACTDIEFLASNDRLFGEVCCRTRRCGELSTRSPPQSLSSLPFRRRWCVATCGSGWPV